MIVLPCTSLFRIIDAILLFLLFTITRPYSAARLSDIVLDSVESVNEIDGVGISLPTVGKDALKKVVEFIKHHQDEKMEGIKTSLDDMTFDTVVTQQWYQDFVKGLDRAMLFELVTAANYMNIRECDKPFLCAFFCLRFHHSSPFANSVI